MPENCRQYEDTGSNGSTKGRAQSGCDERPSRPIFTTLLRSNGGQAVQHPSLRSSEDQAIQQSWHLLWPCHLHQTPHHCFLYLFDSASVSLSQPRSGLTADDSGHDSSFQLTYALLPLIGEKEGLCARWLRFEPTAFRPLEEGACEPWGWREGSPQPWLGDPACHWPSKEVVPRP